MESSVTTPPPVRADAAQLVVRPALPGDLEGLYRLARLAGLTNLPPDREALARRIAAGMEAMTSHDVRAQGAPVLFVVETGEAGAMACGGRIVGTACIFARIGAEWPFYSYRVTRLTQASKAFGKSITHDVLMLANDFDGCAEVGGLFVDPSVRGAAAGRLAARSRYLFIAGHRHWFGRQVISELRGYQDEHGRSPVWEALGREFYDMDFAEADRANGVSGNQFIADLAPKHPIYTSLLPREAREALGRPHTQGRRAQEMLLQEGFRAEGYVDIFDGGPTLCADIDDLKAVRESRCARIVGITAEGGLPDHLVSAGSELSFRAARGGLAVGAGQGVVLHDSLARALGVGVGEEIRHAGF